MTTTLSGDIASTECLCPCALSSHTNVRHRSLQCHTSRSRKVATAHNEQHSSCSTARSQPLCSRYFPFSMIVLFLAADSESEVGVGVDIVVRKRILVAQEADKLPANEKKMLVKA